MMWTTKSSWSHSSRQVLPVVWIFYLLILHSFEKKSYITKFPDISPEIRKIKPTKIKHMKNTGKQFLLSSVYLIVSMLSYILSMFSLISSLFSACSHHSHFILCLHIISSHEAAASSASTPHKQWNFGRDWKESCVHMSKLFETNPSFPWMKHPRENWLVLIKSGSSEIFCCTAENVHSQNWPTNSMYENPIVMGKGSPVVWSSILHVFDCHRQAQLICHVGEMCA